VNEVVNLGTGKLLMVQNTLSTEKSRTLPTCILWPWAGVCSWTEPGVLSSASELFLTACQLGWSW